MVSEEQAKSIDWYRVPVDKTALKAIYKRSDLMGFLQTGGILGLLTFTGGLALYSVGHFPWPLALLIFFLHGTCFAFMINAVHELLHDTVFKTKSLNKFFVYIFAFLGWVNHFAFDASHVRHHRSTLHPPDDLEVVVPVQFTVKDFIRSSFVNPWGVVWVVKNTLRMAQGRFEGDWELKLFPADRPDKRKPVMRWATILLVGHGLILIVAIVTKCWFLPVVTTFGSFYGGWLFFLCNNTQHVGLQDNTADFRLCCRTFIPNPLIRFLYWHMNYHTEHHMYVGVPCYNLGKLHKLIRHDLPPAPVGLYATWTEIGEILKKQKEDPTYQHDPMSGARREQPGLVQNAL
jgi:fatty acid desaturase